MIDVRAIIVDTIDGQQSHRAGSVDRVRQRDREDVGGLENPRAGEAIADRLAFGGRRRVEMGVEVRLGAPVESAYRRMIRQRAVGCRINGECLPSARPADLIAPQVLHFIENSPVALGSGE